MPSQLTAIWLVFFAASGSMVLTTLAISGASAKDSSCSSIRPASILEGQRLGVHHQTVERCVERAVAYGPLAALDDRPRPGKEPTITLEAKTWLVSLACDKAKEHGYPHELWTT